MAAPNTVLLAGFPFTPQEKTASEAIVPGDLVDIVVAAGATQGQLKKHSTAGGAAKPWFARESLTPDRGSVNLPIDVAYAIGETVRWFDGSKCEVLALVAAAAPAIVAGDMLTSDGTGGLKKGNGTTDIVIATAAENVNNSGGGTRARIRVYPL